MTCDAPHEVVRVFLRARLVSQRVQLIDDVLLPLRREDRKLRRRADPSGTVAGRAEVHGSLFGSGDTLASRIAEEFQGAVTKVQISSLFYLAAILLVIGLVTNLIAQIIVRRFEYERTGAE